MFPPSHSPPNHLLLSLLVSLLGLFLCMQTTAFDVRKGNSSVLEVQCMEKERQALLNVKKGLLDPSHRLSSWVEEVNCCQWIGVKCNDITGYVVTLDLHNGYVMGGDAYIERDDTTSLGGEISNSLLDLQYLQHLDLSFNNFKSNPIPQFFGSLVQLRSLNLSHANFGGRIPHQIGNLSNLNYLDLSCLNRSFYYSKAPNFFVSNVDWLSSLRSLIYLDMSGTNLSHLSDLFNNLYNLPSLKHLCLSRCGLGKISSSSSSINRGHANFTSIKYIDLSLNDLSCTIFKPLGNATSLLYLDLSWNQLKCSIPIPLEKMESLYHLDLSFNQLRGHIPTNSLANLSSLSFLNFKDNRFEGWMLVSNVAFSRMTSLTHLDVKDNNLKGPIPDFLGNITSLTYLDLSNNHLEGGIPSNLGNITSLTYLDLSHNHLEGGISSSLGKLCNLQTLSLCRNNLSGDIADEFWFGCISNSLEDMDLSFNELYGHLPEDLGRFSSLRYLYLNGNRLNGSLPTSMGQLTDLVVLDVSFNSLEGLISETHLSHLSKLHVINLSFNSLSFNLSFDWTPPFQLQNASFRSCLLGPRFPSWLRTQKDISYLAISHNGIHDKIPSWFWNVSSNMDYMDLSFNHIYGKLPTLSLALLKKISLIDLRSNLLEGSIPQIPPSAQVLILSNNSFSGTLLDLLCNVSSISNSLSVLDLSENQLVGIIPDCLNYWRGVKYFGLKKNNFSEEIPNSIGYMEDLQSLHLNGNSFSGVLPLSLKNCKSLVVIDVGENMFYGEIPPWIGEHLTQLKILRLHSNGFTGNIPSQLCQITYLQILDLAHNNLQGYIPRCLINITGMSNISGSFSFTMAYLPDCAMVVWKRLELEYQGGIRFVKSIDLSSNSLSGEIPREMMNLIGLMSLNLSRNNLVGKIPSNIGNLSSLESLDFSINRLSGILPVSLANLNFLSSLDLSFNNFSGTIPRSTQLQSFNASSYIENSGLCGPPLSANCTTNETSSQGPDHRSTTNEDGTDIPWFYIGMAMGYIVGFWVVCGFLIFNKSWRNVCFRYVEEVHDWFYVALIVNARKLQRKFGN